MGKWSMIVEGANTYSPAPDRRAARARMERAVYWERGVLIATDYLVNSGGVIYAAQEHLVRTPDELRIPDELLGKREAVDRWLDEHAEGIAELTAARRAAAESQLQRVIPRNMKELVDLLVADPDSLPCEVAEQIAVNRIARSERDRTVGDVMEPIASISASGSVREAAARLVREKGDLLAVVNDGGELIGVITEWDITRAAAMAYADDIAVSKIMTPEVIAACPSESILEVVRRLEHHDISAMPVVGEDGVVGLISGDILAQRTLYRLLQAQT
jgi:glutamate dehydrogenase (NAD(P)+)